MSPYDHAALRTSPLHLASPKSRKVTNYVFISGMASSAYAESSRMTSVPQSSSTDEREVQARRVLEEIA
eukprot:gene10086-8936_t